MPINPDRLADMFNDVLKEATRLRETAEAATKTLQNEVEKIAIASRQGTSRVEEAVASLPNAVGKAVKEQLAAPAEVATAGMVQRLESVHATAQRAADAHSNIVGVFIAAMSAGFVIGLCGGLLLVFKLFR